MKGDLFRGFYDFVITNYSEEVLDNLLDTCDLDSGGAYTNVGYYPHAEMLTLVQKFSEIHDLDIDDLLVDFGHHMFTILAKGSLPFIEKQKDSLEFLSKVEDEIHTGVKKIHEKANPPILNPIKYSNGYLELEYTSHRNLPQLALGLIQGAANHYNDDVEITVKDKISTQASTVFCITRMDSK